MTASKTATTTIHASPRCLDVHTAADYLGICPRTMDNWRSQGRGPSYVRVGRRIVYRIRDLDSYLDARTVEVGR